MGEAIDREGGRDQWIYGEAPDSGEEPGGRKEGPSSRRGRRKIRRSSRLKMRDNLAVADPIQSFYFKNLDFDHKLDCVICAMLACVIPDLSRTVRSLQDLLIVQNTLTLEK